MSNLSNRRLGLEQEFFVVDSTGASSDQADELIHHCRQLAARDNIPPESFEGEWVKNILEIRTEPVLSTEQLAFSYLEIVSTAMRAAEELGLRLYPLAAYPLHVIPRIRDAVNNHLQIRTVGRERFLNAGKCTGVHVHIEVPQAAVDPRVGLAYDSTAEARWEVLNAYNLGTALDPVLIALGRSCPFFEGSSTGLAYHTSRYRGSDLFGWDGVYTQLPEVGALRPYADSAEQFVELQFERHFAWLEAMRDAGIEEELCQEQRDRLLKTSWNPIRLNGHGTIEHRNIDSNLPAVVLGLTLLLHDVHKQVRDRHLTVTPTPEVDQFLIDGDLLRVPEFEVLNKKLLYAAVNEGISNALVRQYCESVLNLADVDHGHPRWLSALVPRPATWQTTEEQLLKKYFPVGEQLSPEEGLRLVRETCDELIRQVDSLHQLQT